MQKTILKASREGEPRGVYAVCSVNRYAIRAALDQACRDRWPVLIEATARQVNPAGGYSGLAPTDFAARVTREAAAAGLDPDLFWLGGDHIGPYPWAPRSAATAMGHAARLVADLVAAGFSKLHIDTTAPCRDDPREADGTLPVELVVARTADLMAVAEQAAHKLRSRPPLYVVGSDVPAPGGTTDPTGRPRVSDPRQVAHVLAAIRKTLAGRGLDPVWPRVLAVVVRTGAEFSSHRVMPFDPVAAQPLVAYIASQPGLVYEAHSTDYQAPEALQALVANGFAILKVGPWLTYTFRETVFGLAAVEREMLAGRKSVQLSDLAAVLDAAMVADPRHWSQHYHGTARERAWLRVNAFADRIRYYWSYPRPAAALARLLANLRRFPPCPQLIAAHLPAMSPTAADTHPAVDPETLIRQRIGAVIDLYAAACGCRS
jgi:D-tagatose-1,6-bisphosphate aldolase subunit GatZ/KbaZ